VANAIRLRPHLRATNRTSAITTPPADDTPFAPSVDDLDRLTDDPGRPRRFVIAIGLALAITVLELLVVMRPRTSDTPRPEPTLVANVALERAAPTPRPTSRPTPRPTPTPAPVAVATTAPVAQRAAPPARRHAGGVSAAAPRAPRPIVHRIVLPKTAGVSGVARSPGSGSGTGSGSGVGNDTGSGAGEGTGGAGTDAVNANVPCGYVDFMPDDNPRIVGNVSYETIRATVHYPDGHTGSDDFPYPWTYNDYMDTDPWSPLNVRRNNLYVPAQLPPPGADTRRYSDLIRYILDHTNANGGTVLQPCPQ
jgi:hypothetical protein